MTEPATPRLEAPRLLSPAFVAMRGAVKIVIVICTTILGAKGLLESGSVTAIFAGITAIGPVEQAAVAIPETRARVTEIKAVHAPETLKSSD